MKKILLAVTLTICSSFSFAKLNCSKSGTTILYINGILTSSTEAEEDALLIERATYQGSPLHTYIDSKEDGEVINSYNTSLGFKLDIMESSVQKLVTEKGKTRDEAWHIVNSTLYESSITGPILDAYDILADEAIEISKEHFDSLKRLETSDTSRLKSFIKTTLKDERKLLLISHSQGGLFTNSAYLEMAEENEIIGNKGETFKSLRGLYRNLQVGTPTSRVLMTEAISRTTMTSYC